MTINLNNLEDTIQFAQKLADSLKPGDIITLKGTLGSGKTTLIRHVIQALSDDPNKDVTSPTFNLVQTYDTKRFPVWHADFYRLESEDDYWELGIDDAPKEAVIIIEWPEIIAHLLPSPCIELELAYGEETGTRTLTLNHHAAEKIA